MTADAKYDGTLVRGAIERNDLVLVVEPMDEGEFWQLAGMVTEIRLVEAQTKAVDLDALNKNLGSPIWIAFSDQKALIETEMSRPQTVQCSNIIVTERDYDALDLRVKFTNLSKCFTAGEESTRKTIDGLSDTKDAVLKFLETHHHTWSLKRDFFSQKDPAKAKEFDARLEVLDEIGKIVK
jgi:hypothetical protein